MAVRIIDIKCKSLHVLVLSLMHVQSNIYEQVYILITVSTRTGCGGQNQLCALAWFACPPVTENPPSIFQPMGLYTHSGMYLHII